MSSAAQQLTDQRAFDIWFSQTFKEPKSKAQKGNWKFKRRIAWAGWRNALSTPRPPPAKPSLTECFTEPLTPGDIEALSRVEAHALPPQTPS